MPLPQQVIEQLGKEHETSQGWAMGAILFSVGMFLFVAVMYLGMKYAYEPIVNGQYVQAKNQVATTANSVSTDNVKQIIGFYSQIANLKSALSNHVYVSTFLQWLQANTEANIYYQNFELSSGNRVSIKGVAKSEADINEQIAVFEASHYVTSVVVSNIASAQNGTGLAFDATLTMDRSVFAPKLSQ